MNYNEFCSTKDLFKAENLYELNTPKKCIFINIMKNYEKKRSKNLNKLSLRKEILYIIIIMKLFNTIFTFNKIIIFSHSSYITLKINKIGTINFYSCYWFHPSQAPTPEEFYINDVKQDQFVTSYDFTTADCTIKLLWNNNIETTQGMFASCVDIIEINLSNFDASQVTDMSFMFERMTSLTSINLTNLNTEKVKTMMGLFESCSSLTSLDISYLDTSQVIDFSGTFQDVHH